MTSVFHDYDPNQPIPTSQSPYTTILAEISASRYERDEAAQCPPDERHRQPSPPLVQNDAPAGDFDMMAPPSSTHPSWQALHDYAQSHASEHGYALSINTTAKNRSRIKLACVCYGQPKNTHKLTPETRVRKNRVSSKTGCRMWIEGKKQQDGTWLLRVGEAQHNHPGKACESWAVQRKRTWGGVGGRIGVGGVTARAEAEQGTSGPGDSGEAAAELPQTAILLPERGGLIWKIVEQEMLRKGEPGQGRDRGVGRTVGVLQARLPGIRIFKRDVYNIRAQIKRARRSAGQQVGDGLDDGDSERDHEAEASEDAAQGDGEGDGEGEVPRPDDDNDDDDDGHAQPSRPRTTLPIPLTRPFVQVDPSLTRQHAEPPPAPSASASASAYARSNEFEIEQLRKENSELRRLLAEKTDDVKKKTIEIASLRSQVDYMHIMDLSGGRGGLAG